MPDTMRLLDGLIGPILSRLDELPEAAHIVHLACGTGTLSLALAERRPDLRITAIDIDPAVIAEAKAAGTAVDFQVMDMTALRLEEHSADAVISRVGLLSPGTPDFAQSAREAARILRPQGVLSLAAWTDTADSPYTRIGLAVLRAVLPAGAVPDFEAVFAQPVPIESHLSAAGLRDVEARWFAWEAEYPDFETWWRFDTGFGPLTALFGALTEQQLARARQMMTDDLAQHRTRTGSYRLPARARLVTARGRS
ncbi:hypothetical protein Kisp01_36890 [Kineosporia sp. NBRC 101677]|uniref:class I SAM-dependent methyltransferase n=1 Tax=Kineosporia sp. NBRC 101677 TaxID=3032197 RepID=UPI0024A6090F|nr:class I SAM-dependent methyltransferase [Kineosporia sp. NBRC 101677]GLY16674.1 hypothetical protein Kisp01_36890 [Kineosporia sp. NBRC 101677]